MNINWNRKYFTIAVYATCAVIVSAIAVMVIFNFDSVMAKLSVLGAVTTPIIIGIFCAYLLNPLMTRIETGPLKKLSDSTNKKYRSKARGIALTLTMLLVLVILGLIALHSFFCTLFLGVNTCFFLYTMMTIPVMLYYLFLTCEKKVFKRGTLLFSLCSLAFLGAALVFDHFCDPFFYTFRRPLTLNETDLMRTINIAFNIALLFGFSTLFILEIHNLINKLNETNDRLNYIATHDALTGLYNRHSLTGALSALKTSERPFCIVMGDLDDFKKVNDTYGHECGDVVLKSVSEVILRNMGGGNTACRWGGEEILMIMYGTAMDCFNTISRIKAQINNLKITHDGTPVKVSMTFGFAASGESGSQDIDAMLSTVDKRLYKGKASGKNVIVVE